MSKCFLKLSKGFQENTLGGHNRTRTYNYLVPKQTLNNLAKLANALTRVASTFLYGAFDCMFLSCHVRVSE